MAAQLVSDPSSSRLTGRRLGVYQLQELLGAGGMGEVYRARDTKLGRDVAIKILPRAFTSDPERLARFEREARMLASLNHPNIGSIYGLEEADAVRALVLELVGGETLADKLAHVSTRKSPASGLPVAESLTIARQIADALDAAHEKGIVHRDLKPANVKITPQGVVKVLDFGLAKAVAADGATPDLTQSPTVTVGGTREGIILGTAAYMSPEQARGKPVDKRTDIWAFGCVVYEMLTGRVAFGRDTITDTLAAIVAREPDWSRLPAATPASIRRLLVRCLDKDQRRRLHDIADGRIDIEDALTASATVVADAVPVGSPTRRRFEWSIAGVLLLTLVATILFYRVGRPVSSSDATPVFSRIVRLTTGPAQEVGPVISPDGKWVAYLSNAGGTTDVWVKFLSGGDPANLTASAGLDITGGTGISGLDISPDGTRIAVMAKPHGAKTPFATWEIPAPLPGAPRKLLEDGLFGLRWSADGRQIAFIRAGASAGDALWVADGDGANRREIIKAQRGMHVHWPAWSRDGFIYFTRTFTPVANLDQADIYRINSRGGTMEPVVATARRAMFPLPTPDGGGLIYAANPTTADLSLWWRPPEGGEPRRLTLGIGEFAEPRMSADGRTVVCALYESRQSLNRISVTSSVAQIEPITDGYNGDLDPNVAPVGDRLVFNSSRAGNRNLWTTRLDGSDPRPLTSGPWNDDRPAFSPDGLQVAFVSDRDGQRGIWLVGRDDGGSPRKLINAETLGALSWSRDSSRVVYSAGTGGWPELWTVSVADGRRARLPTPGAASEPAWSPTRDVIAYMSPTTSGPSFTKVALVDSTGKAVYMKLPPPPADLSAGFAAGTPAWAPDGRRLAVVTNSVSDPASIWIVDPDAQTPYRKLLELPAGPRIRGVTWTPDGSTLIIGKHDATSDIVLLAQTR